MIVDFVVAFSTFGAENLGENWDYFWLSWCGLSVLPVVKLVVLLVVLIAELVRSGGVFSLCELVLSVCCFVGDVVLLLVPFEVVPHRAYCADKAQTLLTPTRGA